MLKSGMIEFDVWLGKSNSRKEASWYANKVIGNNKKIVPFASRVAYRAAAWAMGFPASLETESSEYTGVIL